MQFFVQSMVIVLQLEKLATLIDQYAKEVQA